MRLPLIGLQSAAFNQPRTLTLSFMINSWPLRERSCHDRLSRCRPTECYGDLSRNAIFFISWATGEKIAHFPYEWMSLPFRVSRRGPICPASFAGRLRPGHKFILMRRHPIGPGDRFSSGPQLRRHA
jgi:hypothetical protein